ncbi:MAG: Fic family protein, partial [Acidobacteria bacterium]|nr:Fic family protein [Acidobacteriota bacterium]
MEPMLLAQASPHRGPLTDLAVDLAARAAGLRRGLPQGVSAALADLVRAMNCYYSNLIEGHDTHPVDIERALRHDYSADPRARNLQLEAVAHIAVQRWIDDGGLAGRAATAEGLCELHRRFCTPLPEEMLRLEHPEAGTSAAVVPGALRTRRVQVGLH